MNDDTRQRVAIACQGGGSHTAFTAGVLQRLLEERRYEIVALSGSSGGAVCALLTWYGLAHDDPGMADRLLSEFWQDVAATEPWDVALNNGLVATARLEGVVALPAVSPYQYPPWAEQRLRELLQRRVRPEAIAQVRSGPLLLVGAIDVLSGEFTIFSSARSDITIDAVVASAAVPHLFRAVRVDGSLYWDGLISQNPPVRELPRARPDQIWVIQINPTARRREPTSVADILDRRNELAGNLSLAQELFFIDTINELVASGALAGTDYRIIGVDRIALGRDLDLASKFDRDPALIADLMAHGRQQADEFLARRPTRTP